MSIYLGSAQPTTYKLGAAAVDKLYLGATQVWPDGAPPTDDPYWDYVTLLMRADGSGSTFVDSSPYNHSLTASGATQSTTNGRASWGGSSASFTGSASRIQLPASIYNTLSFPTNYSLPIDYAVEAWLYIPTLSASSHGGTFYSKAVNVDQRSFAFSANSSGLQLSRYGPNNATWQTLTFSATLPTNSWCHVAFARTALSLRAYVNGSQVGSAVSDNFDYNWLYEPYSSTYIGSYGLTNSGLDFAGYIDDLRVTRGSSRGYAGATISVPTKAYPATGTVTAAKITNTRTNAGTNAFVGRGTTASPFYIYGNNWGDSFGAYKFTATSACTISVNFWMYDDSADVGAYPQSVYVKKRTFTTSADSTVYTATGGGVFNISVSLAAGDYIWFSGSAEVTDNVGIIWMIVNAT